MQRLTCRSWGCAVSLILTAGPTEAVASSPGAPPAGFPEAVAWAVAILAAGAASVLWLRCRRLQAAGVAAEERRRRCAAEADDRVHAKCEFLAGMSHELRTPLHAIIGMTELTLATPLDGEQRECLDLVKSSGHTLLGLINDLLDLSKMEAGQLQLDPVDFRLRDLIAETVRTLALGVVKNDLQLDWTIPAEIPDRLNGDAGRLRQVLVNLIGNAIKFTPQGRVTVAIDAGERCGDELHLQVAVRDTGIGIAPEKQAVIFEPYHQAAPATARQYGGTGLGLAITRELVKLMAGRIWVESQVGGGSTFRFTLRCNVRADHPEQETEDMVGLPVMIVDDRPAGAHNLLLALTDLGIAAALAESGRAALPHLVAAARGGQPYPVVICGARHDADGFCLASHLRRDGLLADTRLILLGNTSQPELHAAGYAAVLARPVALPDLRRTLQTQLITTPAAARHALRARRRRLRILLAEDHPGEQKLAERLFAAWGHELIVVGNGQDAVDACARDRFDLILMDVRMPEMDGIEATRAIRAAEASAGPRAPVVGVSAHVCRSDRERCLAAGMDACLPKPIGGKELFDTMVSLTPDVPDHAQARRAGCHACAADGPPASAATPPGRAAECRGSQPAE